MANGKKPKLRRSGIEAEDAAPMGLLAGWVPFATNRPLPRSLATTSPVAALTGWSSRLVIAPFGFLGMAQPHLPADEWLGLCQRNLDARVNELEELAVGRLLEELISLIADRVALAAFHAVMVVVQHLLEGAFVNDRLLALEARALLAFERLHGHRSEFDPPHDAPRRGVALQNLNAIKTGVHEGLEETALGQRARDAAGPQLGIVLQFSGHGFIADDVRNDGSPALFQHAEDLREQTRFGPRLDQVEHAVRHHHVDGIAGDQRVTHPQFLRHGLGGEER